MAERFPDKVYGELGAHYDQAYLASLTDEELAEEIRSLNTWDGDLLYDLCWRAGLGDEYLDAGPEGFEEVVFKAADKLGLAIL